MSTSTNAFTFALEQARTTAIAQMAAEIRGFVPTAVAVRLDVESDDLPGHQITFVGAVRLADGRTLNTDPGLHPWEGSGPDVDEQISAADVNLFADAADWDPDNDLVDEYQVWAEDFRDQTRGWPTTLVDTFRYANGAWIDLPPPPADDTDGPDDGPVERRAIEFGIEHLHGDTVPALIDRSVVSGDVINGVYIRSASPRGITLRVHEEFGADWDPMATGHIDWDAVLAALVTDGDHSTLFGPIRAAVAGGYDLLVFVEDGPRPPAPDTGRVDWTDTGRIVHGPVADRVIDRLGDTGGEVAPGLTVVADDRLARRFGDGTHGSVWLCRSGAVDVTAINDPNLRNAVLNAVARDADLIEVANTEEDRTTTYVDATVVLTAADRRLIDNRSGRCIFDGLWVDGGDPAGRDPVYLTVDGPSVSEAMALLAGEAAHGLLAVAALARTIGATTVRVTATGWSDALDSVADWAAERAAAQADGVVGGIGSVTIGMEGRSARLVGFTEADGRRWVSGPPTERLAGMFANSRSRVLVERAWNCRASDLPAVPDDGVFTVAVAAPAAAGAGSGMWRIATRDEDGKVVWWNDSDGWGTCDGTRASRFTDAERDRSSLPMADAADAPVWWVPDVPTGRQHRKAVDDLAAMGVSRRFAGRIITQGIYDRAPDPVAAADAVAARTRSQRR